MLVYHRLQFFESEAKIHVVFHKLADIVKRLFLTLAKILQFIVGSKTNDDGKIRVAKMSIRYMTLPGHTADSIVYGIGNVLFTGDTLFTEAVVTSIMANKFKLVNPSKIEAPVRPAIIDQFINMAKLTDIQAACANLTDDERSTAILYMIYDTTANYTSYMTEVINTFSKNMLLNGEMQKLTVIINSGEYNRLQSHRSPGLCMKN